MSRGVLLTLVVLALITGITWVVMSGQSLAVMAEVVGLCVVLGVLSLLRTRGRSEA